LSPISTQEPPSFLTYRLMLSAPVLLVVIRTSTSMSEPAEVGIETVGFARSVIVTVASVGSVDPTAVAGCAPVPASVIAC
jgi:hypothetical protein